MVTAERTPLAQQDERIRQAWAALCGARAVAWRSPNAETLRVEAMCEHVVNDLLDARYRMQTAEKLVKA
jgi:hypothetical protein